MTAPTKPRAHCEKIDKRPLVGLAAKDEAGQRVHLDSHKTAVGAAVEIVSGPGLFDRRCNRLWNEGIGMKPIQMKRRLGDSGAFVMIGRLGLADITDFPDDRMIGERSQPLNQPESNSFESGLCAAVGLSNTATAKTEVFFTQVRHQPFKIDGESWMITTNTDQPVNRTAENAAVKVLSVATKRHRVHGRPR